MVTAAGLLCLLVEEEPLNSGASEDPVAEGGILGTFCAAPMGWNSWNSFAQHPSDSTRSVRRASGCIVLRENRVRENKPGGDPSIIHGVPLAGGIAVVSIADVSIFPGFYGGVAAHNLILKNTVVDNQSYDLVYDGLGTGNHFLFNRCETSLPGGLCRGEKSEH